MLLNGRNHRIKFSVAGIIVTLGIVFGDIGTSPLYVGLLSIVMLSWYNGRKITNRFLRFLPVGQYIDVIKDLRNDLSLPKIATNLVFLTKANRATDIESIIIMSILRPKRADHYWLIHVDILDDP